MGTMPAVSLRYCPVCGRDLQSRPAPNTCPGCGLAYDAHTCVWRSSRSWAHIAARYVTLGVLVGVGAAMLYRIEFEQVPDPSFTLVWAVLAPAAVLLFQRVVGGRIGGRFVALTPGGVLVGTRGTPVLVAWADFDRFTQRGGIPRIQRRSTAVSLAIDGIFDNAAEQTGFRAAVTAAAERWRRSEGGGRRGRGISASELE